MKRIFAIVLIIPMLLCGCGKEKDAWEGFDIGSSDFEFDLSTPSSSAGESATFYLEIPTFSTPMTRAYDAKAKGKSYMNTLTKVMGTRGEDFKITYSNEAQMDLILFRNAEANSSFSVNLWPNGTQSVSFLINYTDSVDLAVEYARAYLGFDIGEKAIQQLIDYVDSHDNSSIYIYDNAAGRSLDFSATDSYAYISGSCDIK